MVSYQLHTAVKTDCVNAVKACLFMAKEIPSFTLNQEDEHGVTGLIEACISGNAEIVQLLLDAGCPAQPTGDFRHTPLRGATVCGNEHLIPILLKAGADPNALSDGNRTPLMGACFLRGGVDREKSALCVKALLEDPRTDPTIRNSFGESALDLATSRKYTESIALVEKALVGWEKGRGGCSTIDGSDSESSKKKRKVPPDSEPSFESIRAHLEALQKEGKLVDLLNTAWRGDANTNMQDRIMTELKCLGKE